MLLKEFLTKVWQTPNQLLKAVLEDLQVPKHVAGCRALGIINKFILVALSGEFLR